MKRKRTQNSRKIKKREQKENTKTKRIQGIRIGMNAYIKNDNKNTTIIGIKEKRKKKIQRTQNRRKYKGKKNEYKEVGEYKD